MERYDIAIIGTGPAGLSAAITATVRNKKVLLLGPANLSEKVQKAHLIQNYLGLPEISGEGLVKAYQKHLEAMNISVTDARVNAIYNMGSYFGIQASGEIYEADTVILATGVVTGKMLEGEKEFLGRGVSYCATCDAMLYKGKKVAVIGYSKREEAEAEFLAEVVDKVYYFPMYRDEPQLSENIEIVREVPKKIFGTDLVEGLQTNKGEWKVDGIFVLRESISPEQLLGGVELDGVHVKVNLKMETSISGCYACGDITGMPYQYIKAAGQGNVAALSAVEYLAKNKEKKVE